MNGRRGNPSRAAGERARHAGYACGIVILDRHNGPWRHAALRFVQTLIGIVAAAGVSVVPKLLPLRR